MQFSTYRRAYFLCPKGAICAGRRETVKKYINRWSYWLGVASAVIALVMRTFNAFGVWLPGTVVQGMTIWYMSFYKAALLFLLINIATALEGWSRILLSQSSNAMHGDHPVAVEKPGGKFRTASAGS